MKKSPSNQGFCKSGIRLGGGTSALLIKRYKKTTIFQLQYISNFIHPSWSMICKWESWIKESQDLKLGTNIAPNQLKQNQVDVVILFTYSSCI